MSIAGPDVAGNQPGSFWYTGSGRRQWLESPFQSFESLEHEEDEQQLTAAAVEQLKKLPPPERMKTVLIKDEEDVESGPGAYKPVKVKHLRRGARQRLVEVAMETVDQDNERLLKKIRDRIDTLGQRIPSVEVRFKNLSLEADVYVGSRALPTILNFYRNMVEGLLGMVGVVPRGTKRKFTILKDVNGILKPGRFTLLLGPPGSGKSTLMLALAGKLDNNLKMQGEITYNGHTLGEFVPQRTASYISQVDNHIGELTVRETIDFAARCQGVGFRFELIRDMLQKEEEMGIVPDPDIDAFMKSIAVQGKKHSLMTDYMIKILGLDICADTLVGNEMLRGISGGQKKRVTTAEMAVGAKKVLFADEISTGLDSSTTFQIVKAMRNIAHLLDTNILMALLQPPPESFEQFDDIILMAEGRIVYQGPREDILGFFESVGFRCPPRKAVADFLQEVTSKKDQEAYWVGRGSYKYVPVSAFCEAFVRGPLGQELRVALAQPFDKGKSHSQSLARTTYGLPEWQIFRASLEREVTLMARNRFLYIFRTSQVLFMAVVTGTLFLRTTLSPNSLIHGNLYLGVLFFSLIHMMFNGFSEMSVMVGRLSIFYKQRDNLFYPAWAFSLPAVILRLPYSILEATIWSGVLYFMVGLAPDAGRFFKFWLLMLAVHQMALALFRLIGALGRSMTVANTFGSFALVLVFLLGGFVLAKPNIPPWVIWGYWISPLSYGQNAIGVNEFNAPRWNKPYEGDTLGHAVLRLRGAFTQSWWYWLGVGVLFAYAALFNVLVTAALAYLNPWGKSAPPTIPNESADVPEDVPPTDKSQTDSHLLGGNGWTGLRNGEDGSAHEQRVKELELMQPAINPGERITSPTTRGQRALVPVQAHDEAGTRGHGRGGSLEVKEEDGDHKDDGGGGAEMVELDIEGHEEIIGSEGGARASAGGSSALAASAVPGVLAQKTKKKKPGGLVLPFTPLAMVFKNVCYDVDMPKTADAGDGTGAGSAKKRLRLLWNVTGAFQPGVLTALVGVSGAGKTTLMDVLAGRKTGGYVEGSIQVGGYPKSQETFARVSGYVEQTDIHSPQLTVHESLTYSASLRLPPEVDAVTRKRYVEDVMELVELGDLRGALVGLPGLSGLSTEQRKRLTIAVELVANPSIIFMDEPTSGLDARAAAIVMRTVRNTVNTGRTVVCTIHQPSIDIFEAFDELLLLKRGGHVIYSGPLGVHSRTLIDYLQGIEGVPRMPPGANPATWMLEVTSPSMEARLGVDFAQIIRGSTLFRDVLATVERLSTPAPGAQPLSFPSVYARSFRVQVSTNIWKQSVTYWRSPDYNAIRFFFTVIVGLLFGAVFWGKGNQRGSQVDVFNVAGALYAAVLFLGVSNASSVQPVVAVERAVFYRERAAGMYSPMPYAVAQGAIEIPYVLLQSIIYSVITYAMIHFEWTAAKFFWYWAFMFLTLMYFTFYGMMAVGLTPSLQMAAVISSFFYSVWNLFSGFLIPQPMIPGWWIWFYWSNPVAWTLYGLIGSQLGDVTSLIEATTPTGQGLVSIPVKDFIRTYFGFRTPMLGVVIAVLCAFNIQFWAVFASSISYFNFQRR